MAVTSTGRQIRAKNRSAHRGSSRAALSSKDSTTYPADIHFLNTRFAPVQDRSPFIKEKVLEQEFFTSLAHFCNAYGLTTSPLRHLPYPVNIWWSFREAARAVRAFDQRCALLVAQNDHGRVCLVTERTFYTGHGLFYIPLMPLYRMLKQKRQKQMSMLLLSICAYLLQVANVPFFGHQGCFMYNAYSDVEEWLLGGDESWDRETLRIVKSEIREKDTGGDSLLRRMRAKVHLAQLKRRVRSFSGNTPLNRMAARIGTEVLRLWQDYPGIAISDHLPLTHDEQEYDSDIIMLDQYLSFFWTDEGILAHHVMEQVNCQLQELGGVEEPVSRQVFDKPMAAPFHDDDYCKRFFTILNDLCTLLYKIP